MLHVFSTIGATATNSDGVYPLGGLTLAGNTLIGTCTDGGTNGSGVVFSLNTNGSNFTVLHAFSGTDGSFLIGDLILSSNTLFGACADGGNSDSDGTLFSLSTNGGNFTVLHYFQLDSDGANPFGAVTLLGGTLYGLAAEGGPNNTGTIYSLSTNGSNFLVRYNFSAADGNGNNSDGTFPFGGMALSGGAIYGLAGSGGTNGDGYGTIFSLSLPVPPTPSITLSSTNVVLTWTNTATGFTLETTTNLLPPVSWGVVPGTPAILNGQFTVTNGATELQRYYRLAQ